MSVLSSRKTLKLVTLFILGALFFYELPVTFVHVVEYYSWSKTYPDLSRPPESVTSTFAPEALPIRKIVPQKHRYRPDGLLEVNEEGTHPIYELISRAEKEWEEKLQRSSKTLREAVDEYKRRYKRPPPKGFDAWWKYAKDNGVQLPDEYDQIYNDLEVFHGIAPGDLIKAQAENERRKDTYTIGKNESGGVVEVVTWAFREGAFDQLIVGSKDTIKLFGQVKDLLPPFRMTFTPHDAPHRVSDYAVTSAFLDAASSRSYLEQSMLPRAQSAGWVSACPPDSLARRKPINLDSPPPRPTKKTFIYDHLRTMDPCNHPDHFYHHGQFLTHELGPKPERVMVPEFSYCSTMIHHDIRFPTPYMWVEDINPRTDDPEWNEKVEERLLWRGSTTGIFHHEKARWRSSHRHHLVTFANGVDGTANILSPNKTRSEQVGKGREMRNARINPAVFDVAFTGQPIACSPSVCPRVRSAYPFREYQSVKEAGRYKYVFDIDGNGWSGRFKRLMTSNSLVFKTTIYPEWYTDRIAPWVHYIPIQLDLSDLHDALVFFRGDGNGDGAHEQLAHKIAVAGRNWSKSFWRKEDLAAYTLRLTLEYVRLMSMDRDAMSFDENDIPDDE